MTFLALALALLVLPKFENGHCFDGPLPMMEHEGARRDNGRRIFSRVETMRTPYEKDAERSATSSYYANVGKSNSEGWEMGKNGLQFRNTVVTPESVVAASGTNRREPAPVTDAPNGSEGKKLEKGASPAGSLSPQHKSGSSESESGKAEKIGPQLDLRGISVESDRKQVAKQPAERPKNISDAAVALHVANSAKKPCLEGYVVDENGVCQKSLQPRSDKSFRLKRRKRDQEPEHKPSYADVVRYGPNSPRPATKANSPQTQDQASRNEEGRNAEQATPKPVGRVYLTRRTKGGKHTSDANKPSVQQQRNRQRRPQDESVTPEPKSSDPMTKSPASDSDPTKSGRRRFHEAEDRSNAKARTVTATPTEKSKTTASSRIHSAKSDANQEFLSVERSGSPSSQTRGGQSTVSNPQRKSVDLHRLKRWIADLF